MKIGCPKEVKPQEYRVGLTPDAVRAAATSTDRTAHPASGVHGRERTIWWLDEAAAGPGA